MADGGTEVQKRLLSVEEAAAYVGISSRSLYNRTAAKTTNPFPVKPKRIGKLVKFDRKDLDAWIETL
jgi:predicted DNA-binding transcriptional regulator AlpA